MPTPKINGTIQPIRTKFTTRYDPAKGYVVTQEFESAGDNLGGLALQAKNAGMDYSLDSNGRKSRLVMSTTGAAPGFPEQATSTWQLYTNEIQKDIREHPAALALPTTKTSPAIETLAEIMEAVRVHNEGAPFQDGAFNSATWPIYQLMIHGVTSFNVSGYSARATISLPFLFAGAVPGVSPDSLMAQLIGGIPVQIPSTTYFRWGWRKMGSSRSFSGNNRTEINIEWQLASWSRLLYSDITDLPV